MAKNLVVRRDIRKPRRGRGAPYLKYLVFSALALIFLVVVTPYLLRHKSRDVTTKMPVPDRGAITKELPKLAQQQPGAAGPADSTADTTTPGAVTSTVPAAPTTPQPLGSVEPPQTQPAPQSAEKGLASSNEASPAETKTELPAAAPAEPSTPAQPPQAVQKPLFPAAPKASAPVRPAQTEQTAPKVLFPQKASRSHGPVVGSQRASGMKVTRTVSHRTKTAFSAKPAHRPMARHVAQQTVSPGVKGDYAVQVGSVFRTLGQAESLRRRLAARGYRSSVRQVARLGYLVVTSPGTKSKAYTLLAQMNAEGLRNAKVVPVDPNAR